MESMRTQAPQKTTISSPQSLPKTYIAHHMGSNDTVLFFAACKTTGFMLPSNNQPFSCAVAVLSEKDKKLCDLEMQPCNNAETPLNFAGRVPDVGAKPVEIRRYFW